MVTMDGQLAVQPQVLIAGRMQLLVTHSSARESLALTGYAGRTCGDPMNLTTTAV
jgi:hypothetical protein